MAKSLPTKESTSNGHTVDHKGSQTTADDDRPNGVSTLTNASATLNGMPSPKTSSPNSPSRSQPGRSTFLSKILRFIAPCIYPSPVAHPIELPDFIPPPPEEKAQSNLSVQQEPIVDETQDEEPSKPVVEPQEHQLEEPIPLPPVGEFTEVVVPPTPTIPHLLPPEETEGMTSGAVQPPGSKGDTPVHEKSQHTPISENEDSEYTDEDPDELEDEEDRLIYSGGAGIPIGPVRYSSISLIFFQYLYTYSLSGWDPSTPSSCTRSSSCW